MRSSRASRSTVVFYGGLALMMVWIFYWNRFFLADLRLALAISTIVVAAIYVYVRFSRDVGEP